MTTFTQLTTESIKEYTLTEPGKHVFLLCNTSGDYIFTLAIPEVEVFIFALCVGHDAENFDLRIQQIHSARQTTSQAIVHFLGHDASKMSYNGMIRINKEATQSNANQQNINLLLSKDAKAYSFPSLEIATDDVICHHGSATSQINSDHLLYAQTRGITPENAQHMMAQGFVHNFFHEIEMHGAFPELALLKESFISI